MIAPDHRLTCRELDERANRLANALLARGVTPGERIAVLSHPRAEYVELYVAAAKLGVTVVALNTRLHPEEIAYCLELGARRSKAIVVCNPGCSLTPAEVVAQCLERLAGYKRPRYVEFLDAEQMPRSTTGKLLRHELAARGADPGQRV